MIVNLTPHSITILTPTGDHLFPAGPRETWARIGEVRERIADVHLAGDAFVPVNRKRFDRPSATGIPPIQGGVVFVVSSIVAEAFPERDDFLVPDEVQRDMKGEIIGCHSLARLLRST